jgi:hypothetical protein
MSANGGRPNGSVEGSRSGLSVDAVGAVAALIVVHPGP